MFRRKKKLTLRQVHELYLLLEHALPEKEEKFLLDEIDEIIKGMKSSDVFIQAVKIMYPKDNLEGSNAIKILSLFIRGLKQNDFFDYVQFVRTINGRRPS